MQITFQGFEGYAYGALQPSVVLRTPLQSKSKEADTSNLEQILQAAQKTCESKGFHFDVPSEDVPRGPLMFAQVLAALNVLCGDQRFSLPKVFEEDGAYAFSIPTCSVDLTWHNMKSIPVFLKQSSGVISDKQLADWFETLRSQHRHFLPGGTNSMNFIGAAIKHDVPVMIFRRDYLIFGYGSGSSIFKSSIIDTETSIGVSLASSKVDTNRLLKVSGIPVADQARIQTLQQARHFASQFEYPVVLKPNNESQGRGIFANILDADELARCFADLKKSYSVILIEKHIVGDHYRIDFMGDDLIKAVRRRAPSVTGDGVSTVRQLIDELNMDPERLDPYSSKKLVVLDEDLERCLRKQHLSLDSILPTGQSAYLKSISNLGRGGSQVHIEQEIHPENYALCRKIARIMRLEVLGIDILSPDLSQPWYSNGAAICEVNAQPQLGASQTAVYWKLLRKYLRPKARVELHISNEADMKSDSLFDTSLSTIKLNLSVRELLENGCPTQYFDELLISEDVSEADLCKARQLLAYEAGQ